MENPSTLKVQNGTNAPLPSREDIQGSLSLRGLFCQKRNHEQPQNLNRRSLRYLVVRRPLIIISYIHYTQKNQPNLSLNQVEAKCPEKQYKLEHIINLNIIATILKIVNTKSLNQISTKDGQHFKDPPKSKPILEPTVLLPA